MVAKLSDLGNRTYGDNPQMEGPMDMPPQSAKELWDSEALGSSLSHLPSCSLARRPLSSHPNMKHCLEIHVTLTEELGTVPPISHSWMAPLVEDMLWDVRTGLTKVVLIGPGRAFLFYGRHSLGGGLTTDKARNSTFLLTRADTWVGKLAFLTTDPMTIQEGSHCPHHNGLLCEGEGARTSTCESASPTTLQIWPFEWFPHKGYLWGWWFWPSTITMSAPKRPRWQQMVERPKASIALVAITFLTLWAWEQQELTIDGFLDVIQVW